MSKIINISDRLDNEKPKLKIGENEYEVNNTMEVVLKFEELMSENNTENLIKGIELALGKEASKALNLKANSITNFKVIVIAIMAAIQDIDYDEAASRFQG